MQVPLIFIRLSMHHYTLNLYKYVLHGNKLVQRMVKNRLSICMQQAKSGNSKIGTLHGDSHHNILFLH